MSEFSQAASEWQAFYTTLAGVSATMAGLLFTSLSLNPNLLSNRYLKSVAQQAFMNFSLLLVLALLLLQPHPRPLSLGLSLGVLGLFSGGRLTRGMLGLREAHHLASETPWAVRLMRLSQLAYFALVPIGGLLTTASARALQALPLVTFTLLIGTGRLAWELLQHGRSTPGESQLFQETNDNA